MADTSRELILVVDDDPATRTALERSLELDGFEVETAQSAEEALGFLQTGTPALVISDVVMGGMTGIALLDQIRHQDPELPVILCTGYGTIESAVDAMRKGATDFLTKPVDLQKLSLTVERALMTSALRADNRALRRQLLQRHTFQGMIGRSPLMQAVFQQIESVATTDVTVLIRGESGTGKELVARALHALSPRCDQDLVTVNCGAVAESLIESELFGHERGAFTGAFRRKEGKASLADQGTLFLDEVAELSPVAQTRLLRLVQEQTYERVGGNKPLQVDARIIAATNQNLEAMLDDGAFRRDLYYRLKVITVDLPPLRERPEDVELLTRAFLREFARTHQRPAPVLHKSAVAALQAAEWPGNIRELRNLCESLCVTSPAKVITASLLPPSLTPNGDAPLEPSLLDGTYSLSALERHAIFQTLARTGGNKAEAAKILGIGLKTLYRRLEAYGAGPGVEEPDDD